MSQNAFASYRNPDEQGVMPAPPPVATRQPRPWQSNAFAAASSPVQAQQPAQPMMAAEPQRNAFQRGLSSIAAGVLGPQRTKELDAERLAAKQTRAKALLGAYENFANLPEAQRAQAIQGSVRDLSAMSGRPPEAILADTDFSDAGMQQKIATLRGLAGVVSEPMSEYQRAEIELKKQAAEPKASIYNTPKGLVEAAPGSDPKVVFATEPEEKPPWVGAVKNEQGQWVYDPNYIKGYNQMHPQGGGSSGQSKFRPATRDEAARYGAEAGQIDVSTGRFYPSGGQNAGEFSASERKTYRDRASAIKTLQHLVSDYRSAVDTYGPQLMDSESDGGLGFKKTDRAQQLLAKHNNLMMFLKGPELFNLGVLTGPDVERLQRTLPEPVGASTIGQNKDTLSVGLNSLDEFTKYKMSLIPEQFRSLPADDGATSVQSATQPPAIDLDPEVSQLLDEAAAEEQSAPASAARERPNFAWGAPSAPPASGPMGTRARNPNDVSDLLEKYR